MGYTDRFDGEKKKWKEERTGGMTLSCPNDDYSTMEQTCVITHMMTHCGLK